MGIFPPGMGLAHPNFGRGGPGFYPPKVHLAPLENPPRHEEQHLNRLYCDAGYYARCL